MAFFGSIFSVLDHYPTYFSDSNLGLVLRRDQGGPGRRKIHRADEDAPDVGCTIADGIGVAMKYDRGRRDRRIATSPGGRHKGRRSKGIGRRGPPLSVGELVVGYASHGAEVDHDLLRRDLILWLYDSELGQTDTNILHHGA
jgi:hypothetical protein